MECIHPNMQSDSRQQTAYLLLADLPNIGTPGKPKIQQEPLSFKGLVGDEISF
jgi:hypothetical protein